MSYMAIFRQKAEMPVLPTSIKGSVETFVQYLSLCVTVLLLFQMSKVVLLSFKTKTRYAFRPTLYK